MWKWQKRRTRVDRSSCSPLKNMDTHLWRRVFWFKTSVKDCRWETDADLESTRIWSTTQEVTLLSRVFFDRVPVLHRNHYGQSLKVPGPRTPVSPMGPKPTTGPLKSGVFFSVQPQEILPPGSCAKKNEPRFL